MQKKYAVFTMDVEAFTDTECVFNSKETVDVDLLDGFDEYIKILDEHDIKCTMFTVGKLAPKMVDKLKTCIDNGHELALHNYEHTAPVDIDPKDFKANLSKVKDELSKLFSTEISGFRAPFFSMDKPHLDIIRKLGFKYDSSFLDFSAARHTVDLDLHDYDRVSKHIYNKGNFFEFGLPNHRSFGVKFPVSGGGYVRLGCWPLVKGFIKQYLRKSDYYVFYLHPFELTNQKVPVLKDLKLHDIIYLKYGIKTYAQHIKQIIDMLKSLGYDFITFDTLVNKLEEEKHLGS